MSDHIKFGNKYIELCKGKRIFSRGEFYGYEGGVWNKLPYIRKEFWELSSKNGAKANSGYVSSVMDYVGNKIGVDDDDLDWHDDLINLGNGVLSLDTMKLKAHDPKHYFTSQLGFEYNAQAGCKTWLKFIDEVLVNSDQKPDKSMAEFIQEAFGYSLTASIEHEISFWMIGEGANGKSTMLKVLNALAGSAALHLNLGILDRDKYQLAQLGGKRVVICTEAPETTVADATLKAIISGDTMNVRSPYGKPFSLTPKAKVWWAMNNAPRVNDSSEGFWRKMKVIPFNRTFEVDERDRKLITKLLKELPGIFNWALEGLQRLEENGYFTECDQIDDATLQYREESDLTKQHLADRTVQTQSGYATSKELYEDYRNWCKENGYKALTHNRVARDWRRLRLKPDRDPKGNQRIWYGIELLSDSSDTTILK